MQREADRERMCKDLTEPELVHMFETLPFHKGWDYETRLRSVLRHFRSGGRVKRAEGAEAVLRDFALPGPLSPRLNGSSIRHPSRRPC